MPPYSKQGLRRLSFVKPTLVFIFALTSPARGGQYHYKDILVGERAAGLGGTYTALSDDPSGIYHNPAGILFGLENYISLSANAYTSHQQRYKNIYPNQDYAYRSQDLVPVFFGFTQSWRKRKIGFAVIVPDSNLIDQSDTVTKDTDATGNAKSFTRKFFRQDITYLAGPSYAFELLENMAVGFSALGLFRKVKLIDNTTILFSPLGTGEYSFYLSNFNLTSYGFVPKIGIQYMPLPQWSIGLVVSKPYNLGGSGSGQVTSTNHDTDGTPKTPTGVFNTDITRTDHDNVFYNIPSNLQVSLGNAYFFNKEFLLTGQLDVYGPQNNFREFPIRTTINWGLGAEFYLYEWIAIRSGVYSNNTKTKPIDTNGKDQPPFVNLLGFTLGASLFRSGTSLSLTGSYSVGKGRGQAFADSVLTQEVQESQISFYLSGSYQL